MSTEKDFQNEITELNKDVEKLSTIASVSNQLDVIMRGVKRVFHFGFNVVSDATIQNAIIDALNKCIHILNKELPNETTTQQALKLGTATIISRRISLLTANTDMCEFAKVLATMKSETSTMSHLNNEEAFVEHYTHRIWKRQYAEHMEQMNQLKKENAELKEAVEKAQADMEQLNQLKKENAELKEAVEKAQADLANSQQRLNVLSKSVKNIIWGASATATIC